jgi:hypothetical protein
MKPVSAAVLMLAMLAGCASHPMLSPSGSGDGGEIVLLAFPPDGGAVLWDGWAGGFVNDYCVQCHNPTASCFGSGCHLPGDPRTPDFQAKTTVVQDALQIRCGICVNQDPDWDCGTTAPKTFPVTNGGNPLPTDEQRGLLVGWIDAGCP